MDPRLTGDIAANFQDYSVSVPKDISPEDPKFGLMLTDKKGHLISTGSSFSSGVYTRDLTFARNVLIKALAAHPGEKIYEVCLDIVNKQIENINKIAKGILPAPPPSHSIPG